MLRHSMIVLSVVLISATQLPAQQRADRFMTQDTVQERVRIGWSPIRIAKWTTLLASAGAAGYGFAQNQNADDEYAAIERECDETPALCTRNAETDEYTNPALEQRYQRVIERDDNARLALLAGQIGIAASVIMFILDLPDATTADDIPYDPKSLRFDLRRDGGADLGFEFAVPRF